LLAAGTVSAWAGYLCLTRWPRRRPQTNSCCRCPPRLKRVQRRTRFHLTHKIQRTSTRASHISAQPVGGPSYPQVVALVLDAIRKVHVPGQQAT
jgi:hypothetical protein